VRKILSIVLALAVVLSLSAVFTAPVAADVSGVHVDFDPACACQPAVYNVTFNLSASLTQGVGCVNIQFPAGTTFDPTGGAWDDGYILIGPAANASAAVEVFGAEVTVTGTTVSFIPPADFEVTDNPILVQFTADAGVTNPCTPGKYYVYVSTCRAPDATPVKSNRITIVPCFSTYMIAWDSSPTYAGIAPDFVPPFKACGQNVSYGPVAPFMFAPGKYQNGFNITLTPDVVGCFGPCTGNVTVYFQLTSSPQFPAGSGLLSHVTLNWTGGPNIQTPYKVLTYDSTATTPSTKFILSKVSIDEDTTDSWAGMIHFDTVGDYTLHFWVVCPGGTGGTCVPGSASSTIVDRTFTIHVYQWKDVGKIILKEKWNLISLPLVPFDTSTDSLLASLDPAALDGDLTNDLISIWNYYDGDWELNPSTLVDGRSYWVRMSYPFVPAGSNYTWYIFGTAKAMPPAAPLAYPMDLGWNMFGFTELADSTYGTYLWNFGASPLPAAPLVYGWNNTGSWLTSGWNMVANPGGALVSGQGYWGYFPNGGVVVPKP
jgi:hypothetical protein